MQINVDLRRTELEMMMSIIDNWNGRGPMQVDRIRLWANHGLDGLRVTGRNDALATNGQRLHVGVRLNACKYLAIEEDEIWMRLLRERGSPQTEKPKVQKDLPHR